MDVHQFNKAVSELAEFEYLLDDQWVPVIVTNSRNKMFLDSGSHLQRATIQLMSVPLGHTGIVHLNADDIEKRLRVKAAAS